MKVYNYNPFTFEYIGWDNAYLDVAESEVQGKEIYSLPAYATFTQPPKHKEDFARVWQDEKWQYIKDYRYNYYKVDSNLFVSVITELGELEEGYLLVTKELGELVKANPDNYIIDNNEVREKTEEEKEAENREFLDALTLTPADVERALYKSKNMDFEDLKALIVQQIPNIDIKGLSIEFRAKDFYRGAMANGMRLFDVVGALLGYTSDDMDYLFQHKELPGDEAE